MRVLIQCGDHLENQKRISLLANSLSENGVEPIIMLYNSSKGSFLKSLGFKLIYLNEYLADKKLLNNKKNIPSVDPECLLFAEGKRNVRLIWPSQIKKNIDKSRLYLLALEEIIRCENPDHICIWNGYTGFVANALRLITIKKKIEHSFLERGLFKDSLFIDKIGVNGASSLTNINSGVWESAQFSDDLRLYCRKIFKLRSNESVDALECEYKNKRLIFFPLQVQLDTNIIYYSPYRTMREAFINIYNKFNDGDTIFVIRPHPEEVEGTKLNLPIYKNVIFSSEKPLEYWINAADIVVTINSTVGLEALVAGKKVVCLGDSIYSGLNSISRLHYDYFGKNDGDEIENYLCYLLANNLIKKDSSYSNAVTSKNIGFKIKEEIIVGKENLIKFKIDSILGNARQVSVGLFFDSSARVDLTYRKNNVLVDGNYIRSMLLEVVGDYDFSFGGSDYDLISIVDVNWQGSNAKSDIVLDYYGAIKYVKGVGYL